jgi:hypothetical protein
MSFISTKPDGNRAISHRLTCLFVGAALLITTAGCGICNKSNHKDLYASHSYSSYNAAANPMLIFDNPTGKRSRAPRVSAEEFGRLPWPVSQYAQGYVNTEEIMSYREYHYSDQYTTSNNQPYIRFHRRFQGQRSSYKYR